MRWSFRYHPLILALGMLLCLAACGGGATATPASDSPDPTSAAAAPTTTAKYESAAAATSDVQGSALNDVESEQEAAKAELEPEREFPPFPSFEDPCAEPVEAGEVTYSFFLDGKERPVLVSWDDEAAKATLPGIRVGFHGAGWSIDRAKGIFQSRLRSTPQVVVVPSPGTAYSNYWAETAESDLAFVIALNEHLTGALCFDPGDVLFDTLGQGTLVAVEAICNTDIPISRALIGLGLISFLECEPSRNVPINSYHTFEFQADAGAYWDGKWNPPVAQEVEQTGGIGPTPEDVDEWAAVYGCEGPAVQETLPDPGDVLERDTVFYGYPDCETPVLAFGIEPTAKDPLNSAGFPPIDHPAIVKYIAAAAANR